MALAGGSVARDSVTSDPRVIAKYPYYPFLIEAMSSVASRGMDRSWQEVQRIIGVGLNEILLGADVDEKMQDTAGKVFDAVKQTGYHPEKTGPRP